MKSTKKSYTKEEFVREFLALQAKIKKENDAKKEALEAIDARISSYMNKSESCDTNKHDDEIKSIDEKKVALEVEIEYQKEVVDLTDTEEEFELKAIDETEEKVVDITPIVKSVEEIESKPIEKQKEYVKVTDEEVSELPNSNKTIVFNVDINYASSNLNFNGLNLLEKELKDGNLQVGFDIQTGVFEGETIKKIVKKKKPKVKFEDLYAQLSF